MRLLVLVSLLIVILPVSPAWPHASLIASAPDDGAMLTTAPDHADLTFNEVVTPLRLRLFQTGSAAVDLVARSQGNGLVVTLPSGLGRGAYLLSWRVVSLDGHPVGGSISFTVGAVGGAGPAIETEVGNRWLTTGIWLTRLLIFTGLLAGVGGAAFAGLVMPSAHLPRSAVSSLKVLLTVAGLSLVLSVGLHGLDALALPPATLVGAAPWQASLATSYGISAMILAPTFAAAYGSLVTATQSTRRLLAIAALLGTGGALAATGHASSAEPQLVARASVFLHAVCVTFWIGALAPLAVLLHRRAPHAAAALDRFSRFIPWAIATILMTGLVLAIIQLRRLDALWLTAYGWVLATKMLLVLGLLALAAVNRFRLTTRVQAGEAAASRQLVCHIAVEIALAVVILAVVALWRFTPPPRSSPALAGSPVVVHVHDDKGMTNVVITPARVGRASVRIELLGPDLAPLGAKEVSIVLSNPVEGIEPVRRKAEPVGEGAWRADDFLLPVPGEWRVRVEVLVSDFERLLFEGVFQVDR